jgi:Rrf2 family protein
VKLTSQEEYGLRCILTLARPLTESEPPIAPNHGGLAPGGQRLASEHRELTSADRGRAPGSRGLAAGDKGPALTVNQISEREGISTEYAGKLMGVLVRAGLVESVRGRHGGYRLHRPPQEITIAAALAALGGKLYDDETCDRFAGDHSLCVHTRGCTIRSVWSGLQQIIDQVLTRTTLWDLIQQNERSMLERIRDRAAGPVPFEVGDPALARPTREG